MKHRRASFNKWIVVWALVVFSAGPLQAQSKKDSQDDIIAKLASKDARDRYFAILDLESVRELPEPVLKMLIDYLDDLRGGASNVAGAAAELLAKHPYQARRAIPKLLVLLSSKENRGFPSGHAATALEAIGRLALEKHLMELNSDHRKALAQTLIPVFSSGSGSIPAWALIAELIGMLGPDASDAIPILEKKIAESKKEESANKYFHILRVRSDAALRIIMAGWRVGEPGYYEEMKRADVALEKPDPYVLPENRFADALETLVNKMKNIGMAKAYILRKEDTFPFRAYSGFPPAAKLKHNAMSQYLYIGEDAEGRQLPTLPFIVQTMASKNVYPTDFPQVPDYAFIEIGTNGNEPFDRRLKSLGITEGYRQDRLYEFWPSEWWPTKGKLRGEFRIREELRLLWIMVADGEVADGAYAKADDKKLPSLSSFDANKYLCWAAGNGNLQQVEIFLSMGADTSHLEDGVTALMSAAVRGHKDIVQVLLDRGSEVNLQNEAGTNALMYASMEGHSNIVELLLRKGARVNDQDTFGQTALIHAATAGSAETVRLLIAAGANLNIKNRFGITALVAATKHGGSAETVKLLRESGAQE